MVVENHATFGQRIDARTLNLCVMAVEAESVPAEICVIRSQTAGPNELAGSCLTGVIKVAEWLIRTVHEAENDVRRAVRAARSYCHCREQDTEKTVDGYHGRG